MLISHECPISLLEDSLKWNDFEYCLVHLFENYPKYFDFYRKSVLSGRTVYLDNSVFENSVAYSNKNFAKWVEKLSPSHFIIPDVLENYKETIWNYEDFLKDYRNLPGKKIGVVQGKTYQEITDCYNFYLNTDCDLVSISFDYSFYQTLFPKLNKLEAWMNGRQLLLKMMLNDNTIKSNHKVHILGVALPQETKAYTTKDYKFITSIDSSNPVAHGIFGIKYTEEGLKDKVSMKMCNMINNILTDEQKEITNYNIQKFREFAS